MRADVSKNDVKLARIFLRNRRAKLETIAEMVRKLFVEDLSHHSRKIVFKQCFGMREFSSLYALIAEMNEDVSYSHNMGMIGVNGFISFCFS